MMKREIIAIVLLCGILAGCSDTMVYIPEEEVLSGEGTVVRIPVAPEKETEAEAASTQAPAEEETAETEPRQTNSATISKNTGSSSNKGSSTGSKDTANNSATITGSQKPAATEPAVTEPADGEGQITATVPAETEPAATEPEVTEPAPTEPPLYDISWYVPGTLEYAMLDQINAHRADAGLPELAMDERLCAIASCRSYEVSRVWSHTRPDGRDFATVLDDYGYAAGGAQELLVYVLGFADGTAMADRWMQSDAHRQLLLGSWTAAGIGVYDANGYIYVTCLLVE